MATFLIQNYSLGPWSREVSKRIIKKAIFYS